MKAVDESQVGKTAAELVVLTRPPPERPRALPLKGAPPAPGQAGSAAAAG